MVLCLGFASWFCPLGGEGMPPPLLSLSLCHQRPEGLIVVMYLGPFPTCFSHLHNRKHMNRNNHVKHRFAQSRALATLLGWGQACLPSVAAWLRFVRVWGLGPALVLALPLFLSFLSPTGQKRDPRCCFASRRARFFLSLVPCLGFASWLVLALPLELRRACLPPTATWPCPFVRVCGFGFKPDSMPCSLSLSLSATNALGA